MNILIVEDNQSKLKQIKTFVKKCYDKASIHDALSYTAGLRRVYDEKWDLLLLDMSLPVYDMSQQESGGDKKSIAGKEIMKRMLHKKIYIPTIIITQFDTFGENEISINTLNDEFKEDFTKVWCGTINYDDATNKWMIDLNKLLAKVKKEHYYDTDIGG